jgi:hypothetical protein
MAYDNLSGIFPLLIDGNLQISAVNENPVVCVIGTASRGESDSLYTVTGVSQAAADFGRADGSLIRGLFEAVAGGAENIRLLRIGAQPAVLATVGTGLTITTNSKDAGAGAEYSIYWDDTGLRLRIWRTSDDLLIYDNNPAYPSAAVDENEISVAGTATTGPGDIGTLSAPVTLANADGVGGASYTAGDDGILLSRMELFEKLFIAYKLLENEDLDLILPQNVYLDDASVMDMTTAEVTALNVAAPWAASPVYPTAGTFFDALGKVFAQEYLGEWYFWWDLDNDGVAELYPAVGSASASLDAFGNALTSADFHEANFGYQLADFCFRQSEDNAEMLGAIGMLPPLSWSLKDVSNWVGRVPTLTTDSAGNSVIATGGNGTGLLGNKWMAGREAVSGTGLPGHTIDGIDGLAEGGFIATDNGWPDGAQQKDVNDHLVDIGKFLSVVGAQAILSNNSNSTAYAATAANTYMGLVSSLPGNSAPTNKLQPGVRLPFRISVAKLDLLAGAGYVMLQSKPKGIVVSDAPTATRSDSDYRRLSTMRIVKAAIDGVRAAGEPYLGEVITGPRLAALETAIQQVLVKLQKAEFLNRFEVVVTSTPTQRVQGQADVELLLVPAFELRQLTVTVALAAQ